jgi:ketose-bisphosphate aldolase
LKVMKLDHLLGKAQSGHYAVGSFSPRNTFLIEYVLKAAQNQASPVIVQISANELGWFNLSAAEFGKRFYEIKNQFTIPAALHLDHTKKFSVIREAIDAGFTSVMIDASDKAFEDNIATTKYVVEYAHQRGVAVEAELGKIGATDNMETEKSDKEFYTVPDEAREFVRRTGVDALAISIGSAHGVYKVKDPKIDFERLREIRHVTDIPLVLHGGSGLPEHTVKKAVTLEGGGVSKLNIATDLELVFLKELGRSSRLSNEEVWNLDRGLLDKAGRAVQSKVEAVIENYLGSGGRADDFFETASV